MNVIQFIIPEIFLSFSIFVLLMIGVFLKNSFEIIYRLSILVIISILLIIFTGNIDYAKIFNKSFVIDSFSSYSKILILISSFFILLITKKNC